MKSNKADQKKQKGSSWYSSYEENNYGELFYALIRVYQPEKVVELGTRAGFSAYHIARGLKANGKGTLDCYDLWENNIENLGLDHLSKQAAEENLKEYKNIVSLTLSDASGIDKKYEKIDILHVDLDNDGEVLEKIVPLWIDKVTKIIIIEGGSAERDKLASKTNSKRLSVKKWLDDLNNPEVELLKEVIDDSDITPDQFVVVGGEEKYREKPISKWLEDLKTRRGDIEYLTIEPYPSLTILRKR